MNNAILQQSFRFVAVLIAVCTIMSAQSRQINLTSPRPVLDALSEIEKLAGIPLNYEDLRYDYAADIQDVGTAISKSSGVQVLVPKGGTLSFSIAVDPANTPGIAGKFHVDVLGSSFFVEPSIWRSANGTDVTAKPVLQTPVTMSGQTGTAFAALQAIIQQVSTTSGVQIVPGTMPLNAFMHSNVQLAASGEPAKYVLARLFAAIAGGATANPGENQMFSGLSYALLFDPKDRNYVLNVHFVNNPGFQQQQAPTPPSPVTPTPGRLGRGRG